MFRIYKKRVTAEALPSAQLHGDVVKFIAAWQGVYKFHQYQVVGRHLPTEKDPEPTIYRMKLWATDPVRAKSKFWYDTELESRQRLFIRSRQHFLPAQTTKFIFLSSTCSIALPGTFCESFGR